MERPGICLEGKCSNRNCEAYEKFVFINLGIRKFDLLCENNKETLKYSEYIGPITSALNNCYWR